MNTTTTINADELLPGDRFLDTEGDVWTVVRTDEQIDGRTHVLADSSWCANCSTYFGPDAKVERVA